jgi:hypothetical protein
MYKLTKSAKKDLTYIVNTLLYSQIIMNDCAKRGQWKRYRLVRDDFNYAIFALYTDFQVETSALEQVKKELIKNVSTN